MDSVQLEKNSIPLSLLPVATFVCDSSGHIVSFNQKAIDMWGSEPSSSLLFSGAIRHFDQFGFEVPREQLPSAKSIAKEETEHKIEIYLERADGTILYVDFISSSVKNNQGKTIGSVNVLKPIHNTTSLDYKRENHPHYFFSVDSKWCLVYINEPILGHIKKIYPNEKNFIGRNLWEIFPELIGTQLEAHYRRAMYEQILVEFEYYYDKSKKWYKISIYPFTIGISVAFKDITKEKAEEQILIRNERFRFSQIFDLTPTFICSFKGSQHIYEIVNQNFLKLVSFKKVIGIPISEVYPQFKNGYFVQFLNESFFAKKAIISSETLVFIQQNLNDSSEEVYIDFVFQPMIENDNSVSGVFVHGVDVTEKVLARKRIEESQQRLAIALDAAQLATWIWDIKNDIVYLTEGYFNLLGDQQGFLSRPFESFIRIIHTEDQNRVLTTLNKAIIEKTTYDLECRIYSSKGQIHWIESKGLCIYSEEGNPLKIFGTINEITHKKNAGLTLQISEQKFRQMAEILPQFVWTLAPDGSCSYLNKRWLAYTGQSEKECLGFGWLNALHPHDLKFLKKILIKSAQKGIPSEYEFRIRNNEGAYRWFLARGLPLKDSDENITQWIGTCTDIDDQKTAQEDHRFLSEATKMLAPISDPQEVIHTLAKICIPRLADWCSIDLFCENNKTKRFVFVTKLAGGKETICLLPGYPFDVTSSDCSWQSFSNQNSNHFVKDNYFTDTISELEKNYKNLDFFSYLTLPLRIHQRIFGAFTFIYSHSKRRYYEKEIHLAEEIIHRASLTIESSELFKQLETAVRIRDDFLSIASHELKTPLTPLKMHLQILSRAIEKGELHKIPIERLNKMVGISNKQVNNLVSLVDDLLDVSRIANGKLELRCEKFLLTEVVQEVIDQYYEQLVSSQSTIEFIKKSQPLGYWDRFRIHQCIANLVSNSIKYGCSKPIKIIIEQLNDKVI
ncbi:MAG: PAS domain-containing protein, partial [Silvanigrellaceae bacterium]|nr:PAS domain-containing protein [Silvanigrellaceae bacterium]